MHAKSAAILCVILDTGTTSTKSSKLSKGKSATDAENAIKLRFTMIFQH